MKPETHRHNFAQIDFNLNPFIVIWEVTQACDLACKHCRASAKRFSNMYELDFKQGKKLLKDISGFGKPLFIITGGDPAKRNDIFKIIESASEFGLRTAMTPSATPLITMEFIGNCKKSGLQRFAVSLDGSNPEIHDSFRGTAGSYNKTMEIIKWSNELEIGLQINTTVTKFNIDDIEKIVQLISGLNIVMWSVFFLVPVGRGKIKDEVTAEEYENIFNRLYDLSQNVKFDIKTTAAPHYRRVIMQRKAKENAGIYNDFYTSGFGIHFEKDNIGRSMQGVNEGKGFVFISHTGEIYPSGFLPVSAGNVKTDDIADIYRNHVIFKTIRNYDLLKGKCGVCEFKKFCGGSRARAYGVTGDYMESEPYCAYIPKQYSQKT